MQTPSSISNISMKPHMMAAPIVFEVDGETKASAGSPKDKGP